MSFAYCYQFKHKTYVKILNIHVFYFQFKRRRVGPKVTRGINLKCVLTSVKNNYDDKILNLHMEFIFKILFIFHI